MCNLETQASRKVTKAAGYTLAEMAISICIVGLLMGGGMAGFSHFFEADKNEQTSRNINLVANVLSSYAQTHDRLPCPADPKAPAERAGREKCPTTGEGVLPWKDLALPRSTAADAWGRPIVYNPASSLTADTIKFAAAIIGNACRTAGWYDAAGNHTNRAKALFCCGGAPPDLEAGPDMVALAASANAIEPAAGDGAGSRRGSFSIPHYMEGPAATLPDVPAVTLSTGAITLSLRSDQLFARAGSGSCSAPIPSVSRPYACVTQNFRSGGGVQEIRDPDTGKMVNVPPLYGIELALTGDRFQVRGVLTNSSVGSTYDDSLGIYVIGSDGSIVGVQMLVPSTKTWAKEDTVNFTAAIDRDVIGIGFFVVPDGYARMDGYSHADLKRLKFITGVFGKINAPASIVDQVPPVLVSVDPATGAEVTIQGAEGISAYHLYSNLNPGRANRTLRSDSICRTGNERVGPNRDFICKRPTALSEADVDPARPALVQIGFEESAGIDCYESHDGHCRGGSLSGKDLIADGEGGYVASIGDNSYDDVAFSIAMTACPQSP